MKTHFGRKYFLIPAAILRNREAQYNYSVFSKAVISKQCNAITTKNEFSFYCKSRENRAEKKNGSEKLIKSPRNRLAGALSNKPLVRFI